MMDTEAAEEDRRLIARIATGDEQALDVLYARYRSRLRSYLWRLLGGDSSLVEEALQDLFVVVWQSAARFRGEATVATWVFQIAHHIALHARQRGDRRLISVPLFAANRSATDGQHDPSAEAVIARLSVHDALDQLSEKHREVLDLFFRQGFSTDEIATILDIPSGTVRSRLSYARKALREQLNDPYLSHERADALTRRGKGA